MSQRVALHELEDKSKSLDALRTHLAEGEREAAAGLYVDDWSVDSLIADAE